MSRKYENFVVLSDGRRIGYALFKRGDAWYVRFVDGSGKRVKKSLGEIPVKYLVNRRQKGGDALRSKYRQQERREAAEEVIRLMMMMSEENFD